MFCAVPLDRARDDHAEQRQRSECDHVERVSPERVGREAIKTPRTRAQTTPTRRTSVPIAAAGTSTAASSANMDRP